MRLYIVMAIFMLTVRFPMVAARKSHDGAAGPVYSGHTRGGMVDTGDFRLVEVAAGGGTTGVGVGATDGCGGVDGEDCEPILVYVHIPKCAGLSMLMHLRQHVLAGSKSARRGVFHALRASQFLALDFDAQNEYGAVVGHFGFGIHVADGWKLSRPALFLTMLREPVSRIVSQFQFENPGAAMTTEDRLFEWLKKVERRRQVR